MNNKPKVGMIMLPFDNEEYFARAAESVLVNTDYSNFDLIAVHNPCEDLKINNEILKIMRRFKSNYLNFDYVVNSKNLYHGPGIMEGFKLLDKNCEFVVLLNDDVFIPGNALSWLSKMVEFIQSNENIATVTPSLYHLNETVYWCGRKPGKADHMCLHFPKGDSRIPTEPFTTESNNFAICLTRKKLLDEFSLNDGPPMYGSDSGYYNRIQEKYPEMTHWIIPEIKLYHANIFSKRINYKKDSVIDG